MRFRGGNVYLTTAIAVFIDDRARFRPRALRLILEHELQHVRDERDIALRQMPSRVRQRQAIRRELIDRNEMTRSAWQSAYSAAQADDFTRSFDQWIGLVRRARPDVPSISRNRDALAGRRQIDTVIRWGVWTALHNAAARRLDDGGPAHLRLGVEIAFALDDRQDPQLWQEVHGRLPDNVA